MANEKKDNTGTIILIVIVIVVLVLVYLFWDKITALFSKGNSAADNKSAGGGGGSGSGSGAGSSSATNAEAKTPPPADPYDLINVGDSIVATIKGKKAYTDNTFKKTFRIYAPGDYIGVVKRKEKTFVQCYSVNGEGFYLTREGIKKYEK